MRILFLLSALIVPTIGYSSGFLLFEHSPRQIGQAYAGATALAQDASTIFYNPAGLTHLRGHRLTLGVSHINLNIKFEDQNSSQTGVGPMTGGDGGSAADSATVPSMFYAYGGDRWSAGIGVYIPFGLATQYDKDWRGRYFGIESAVQVINVNPTFAYRLDDRWSVGVGFNYQMLKAKLTNAIDMGSICVAAQTQALGDAAQAAAACSAQGLTPQNADATSEVEGDSTGYGWNIGIHFRPTSDLQLGAAYRSSVAHQLEGNASYKDVPAAFTNGGSTLVDTDVTAEVELPALLTVGTVYQATEAWSLLADLAWTDWSSFDQLRIQYDSEQADAVEEFNWRDTYRLALGSQYQINPVWTIRGGTAYDQGPIKSRSERNVRLPDNDRYWVTLGGDYTPMENFVLSLAYAHLFVENSQVEQSNEFGHNIKGTYKSAIDIVSMQLNHSI